MPFWRIMETKDVPQWVSQSFIRSALNAGATASREEISSCCADLVRAWCAPGRFEHGLQHLLDMLSRVDLLAPETPNADLVRIATWFHGIVFSTANLDVYTRNGGEDERTSAQIAQTKMTEMGMPEEAIKIVKKLIIGLHNRGFSRTNTQILPDDSEKTRKEGNNSTDTGIVVISDTGIFEAVDMNQNALCDAHLGALAVEPQRYRKYVLRIREEYAHIPLTHFLSARIRIVQRLLARKKIFVSPLAASWENVARQNLSAELEHLTAELAEARESNADLSTLSTLTDAKSPINCADEEDQKTENAILATDISHSFTAVENSTSTSQNISTASTQKVGAENSENLQKNISSANSEFKTVQSLSGDTVVRQVLQTPLSSLEVISDDYDPVRSSKIEKSTTAEIADTAEITNEPSTAKETIENTSVISVETSIKHGIEAEPNF